MVSRGGWDMGCDVGYNTPSLSISFFGEVSTVPPLGQVNKADAAIHIIYIYIHIHYMIIYYIYIEREMFFYMCEPVHIHARSKREQSNISFSRTCSDEPFAAIGCPCTHIVSHLPFS